MTPVHYSNASIKFTILVYCISIYIFSCKPEKIKNKVDESKIQSAYKQIDSLLSVFKSEAQKRGKSIQYNSTQIQFGKVSDIGYWGEYKSSTREIILDSTKWFPLSIHQREWLIFHELGHMLGREHLSMTFKNNEFKSIMFDGKNSGYGNCFFYGFRRTYYLDELFDIKTSEPDWISNPIEYNQIKAEKKKLFFQERFNDNINNWDLKNAKISNGVLTLDKSSYIIPNFNIEQKKDFEIEFELKTSITESKIQFLIGRPDNFYKLITHFDTKKNIIKYSKFSTLEEGVLNSSHTSSTSNIFQKYTIRKIGSKIYYYKDEKIINVLDNIENYINPIVIESSPNGTLDIDNLTLVELL